MKRVLPNDKKLKQSMSSIKVDGNLKTDKNAVAEGFNDIFTSIVKTICDKLSQRSSKRSYVYKRKLRVKFSKTKCCLQFVAKAKSEQSYLIR